MMHPFVCGELACGNLRNRAELLQLLEDLPMVTVAAHAETLARLQAAADVRWDLDTFDAQVRERQARRLVVYEALRKGGYYPWDYQPLQKASERYMRNHMDLKVVEENQRFPRGE
jgi:choline-sulfatase